MNCPVCARDNPAGARFCASCGTSLSESTSSGDGLIGQLIGGRYLIKRIIGEGGMGVVYEAEQRMGSEARRVAIKTLLPALSRDPAIVSRFYRECGIVSQLEHPNTIKFYDFGETPDGSLYISMEYVRGKPLTELIEQGPIALERFLRIMRQVCGALYEAHAMGVIHRDLKPDNIVLTDRAGETDFVKLLDFGIAARTTKASSSETKLTQQGMVLGTPPYMSPEQLVGEAIDARSDIYSLGVIGYEMLTGHLPFEAETPWQWAQKHMTQAPAPLKTVTGDSVAPAAVERAVFHALEKKPNDRPATALDFYAELAEQPAGRDERSPSPAASRKLSTLDDSPESHQFDRTSPMPMPPQAVAPASSALSAGAYGQRTAPAPEFTPAFRTGAALAAPIPQPPYPPRKKRAVWGKVVGGLVSLAALAGAAVGISNYVDSRSPASRPAAESPAVPTATEIAPLVESPTESPLQSIEPAAPPSVTRAPPSRPKDTKPLPPSTTPPTATQPPATSPPVPTSPPQTQPPPVQPPPVQPPPVQPPPVQPPPPLTTGPQGDTACYQARDLASGGNIEGAAALYRRCQQTGGSRAAQLAAAQRIRAQAPGVVRRRAAVGDCAGARSAASSASSIGVGDQAQAELSRSSCAG